MFSKGKGHKKNPLMLSHKKGNNKHIILIVYNGAADS